MPRIFYRTFFSLLPLNLIASHEELIFFSLSTMQILAWFRGERHRYDLVKDDKDEEGSPSRAVQDATSSWLLRLLKAALICLLMVASFFVGQKSMGTSTESTLGRGSNAVFSFYADR